MGHTIYLIEQLWIDSMENRDAYGYSPVGYVYTFEEAQEIANSKFHEPVGWPLKYANMGNPVPEFKFKELRHFRLTDPRPQLNNKTMRTPEQITEELNALKTLRDQIPPTDAFGGDNVAKIDAQIRVLENPFWDEDDVSDEFDPDDDYDIHSCARDALDWVNIDNDYSDGSGSLSENWSSLVGIKVQPMDPRDFAV